MIIDERGKLFGKISVVDVGILVVILALVAGGYYKFFLMGKNSSAAKFDTLEYQFQVREVRQQSVDVIEIGAEVYDTKTGSDMGKIVDKKVAPATGYIDKADGSVALAEKPERFDVTVTVRAPGVETANGYRVNGNMDITRESTQILQTKMIIMEAKMSGVKNISKNE